MRLLDIAKKYLAAGFAPIPVKPNSKIPLIKWEEYNRRKPAIAEIEEWFKDESLNMAIITGELYGITVIDDDTLNGFEGISSPLRVKTPNGMHHYFKYSEKLSRNSVNSQKMVDVRSTGGIVLVPPSTINSKKYQWIGGLKELQNLPSVPDELTQEIKTENTHSNFDLSEYLEVSEGSRNDSLHKALCSILNRLKPEERESIGWTTATGINSRFNPPLPEREVMTTFKSALAFVNNNPPEPKTDNANFTSPVVYSSLSNEDILKVQHRDRLKTGVNKLDDIFQFPTGYYVVCANPGAGKGWFALWLAKKFYQVHSRKSVYFSLEMSEQLIRQRVLQQWSDLTQEQYENDCSTQKAIDMMKKDVLLVYPFGLADTSYQTPDNFENAIEQFYNKGYRIFYFDHLHELEGANVNDTNQKVIEQWGERFQNICNKYPDIWLFIFAQPNGAAETKAIIRRTDISGSKSITQKCDYFISLNRTIEKDKETGVIKIDVTNREVIIWIDKNRIRDQQHTGCKLYLSRTGNFTKALDEDIQINPERNIKKPSSNFSGPDEYGESEIEPI